MRILHVMAGNKHGGAETACIDMCIAMHEAGENVAIVTRPNPNRQALLDKHGVKTYLAPFRGAFDAITPWKIKNVIKDFEPDIVQTWMSRAASKTPRWKPSITKNPYTTFARLGNYYKMKYFKNMDYFIGITPDIQTHIIKHDVQPNRTRHINNFAETETVETPLNRADLGATDDDTVLLGLGRLHDDKAFDTLIDAVNELPEDVHLWIAGEGPDRAKLENQIKNLKLENRVKLLGWRNDRAALLQACDICMFTSRDEPFGTVFVQAWAQKTPVIVSNADGPRQFVKNGEDGLMTLIDNKKEIIDAVLKLRSDKELQDKLIKNGWKRYQNEFTKEKCLQNYLEFYHETLQKQASKTA